MTDILSAIAAENGIIEDTTQNTTTNEAASTDASDENQVTFTDLGIAKPILTALDRSGYTNPTPIQAQAIPFALAGRDLLLSAQTGSGKTAAFVIPVLDRLSRATSFDKLTKALILTPTRELAQQVHDSVRTYSKDMRGLFCVPLVGGAPYNGQITALKKGVQVIVATPGRLLDHINAGRVDLSSLEILVLDEADRMLDMGFADDISDILRAAPTDRQTIMCSATWDGPVGKIAASFTKNPERVSIKVESAHIEEKVYYCDDFDHKNRLLDKIVCQQDMEQIIIFAATKRSTEKLAKQLQEAGHKASFLHGDLPQSKRNRIVQDLRNGKVKILVATDVAARGLDIPAISHVINYDLPRQTEDYVHRIGRCGRAGRTGIAISLCSMDDRPQLNAINRYLDRKMEVCIIEGMEPKKTYVPSENKGNGRGRGRGRSNGGGNGQGRGRAGGGYQGNPANARGRSSDSAPTGQRASNDSGYQGKPRDASGKPNERSGGKPYQGKRTGAPSRGDSTGVPRGERAATGRGRPSGSQGRPAGRSDSRGQGRPTGGNRGNNS
ncbi:MULTISPECIES: DEAD/DEAH box helicase [Psychrobacter]|uniref:DEAD/DEAH box helicase-like protein n=1 Tax=Psychrobacter cryohalolentis (strain ATCC BAA-1226 / DSM 17306 / VKM B-2378 / K5) TaxID=335284 RepID=Q1QAZ5_PSYCK|nr:MULTISPECIES: DEAD/DEAH box helicase [Psychrobacter]ABE75158.1 DEAD/DEAH box helicase-like protein [Psychrobacter cryohalolentis K5]ASE25355.1 ATP-dependent helicase [Psychrobacter cryohalolentis]KAA0939439.1 DEAD/DEAH box helicase [Psychrobacter sp. ANT_H59]WAI87753.1 RNA helicase CrhR [Psychrobacter sp. SC65A.3]